MFDVDLLHGNWLNRKLIGHTSCVNDLAFSSGEGRWLVSAGDDHAVKLWDLHKEDVTSPSFSFSGPSHDILSHIRPHLSGGADSTILKYDWTRHTTNKPEGDGPTETYAQHSDCIRDVSCHPYQDEVFMSASADGCIMLHDGRAGSHMTRSAQSTLEQAAEFSGVSFHPRTEHLFATSDVRGNVRLRDTRMAFGPLHQPTKKGIALKYVSRITRRSVAAYIRPEASSVTWDADGKFGDQDLNWLPTIYSLSDPYPVAVCSGRNLPDGTPSPTNVGTFSDSITMKRGSFGGSAQITRGETYYSSGSEDFRGYLWQIPSLTTLENERHVISADDWSNGAENDILSTPITRLCGRFIFHYLPLYTSTIVQGHLSIVNCTLIHPVFPLIATAGIERHVLLHSPTPDTRWGSNLSLTPTTTRSLPSGALPTTTDQSVIAVDESLGEDVHTIAFFDKYVSSVGSCVSRGHRVDKRQTIPQKIAGRGRKGCIYSTATGDAIR
ncbi:WD40 repeat-like protein [Russula earlei]|uniref:WD40 repeat-like protein n=1 Tax=Russula earlei TaxID=71964 RepID=A0ACC0U793_9AGAM|nr:WD40 repeat-like protein [Russula earlei]